jgi:hypothetical protein
MFGKRFDIVFLYAPILVAISLFGYAQSTLSSRSVLFSFLVLQGFGLGPYHLGGTWFHYLDRKNRSFYTSSPGQLAKFVIAPVALVVLTMVAMVVSPVFVYAVYFLWTVQHLTQQNVGLLLLYHNHNRGEAIPNREVEIQSQQGAAVLFAFLFLNRVVTHDGLNGLIWQAIILGAFLFTLDRSVRYILDLIRQIRHGAYLNLPALLFWCVSMSFLCTMGFWGTDYLSAIWISQVVHWMQYIGLNHVLIKRKYAGDRVGDLPMARPLLLFAAMVAAMVLIATVGFPVGVGSRQTTGWVQNLMIGFALGGGLAHYWTDAFLWRFREPFNRENILSFLVAEKEANFAGTDVGNAPTRVPELV